MKKQITLWVIFTLSVITLISFFYIKQKTSKTREVVFLGPKEYGQTFGESVKSAKSFYDLFNKALDASNSGNQETAIKLLNESLPHVGIGIEKGMVYKKLAEIYRGQGNLEKELFYVQEWPKYSMNQQINEEAKFRATEIHSFLAAKNQADQK